MKTAITGGPRTGKTTISREHEKVKHTDDLLELGWSEASEAASLWFDDPEILTVEGVTVPRALRKWLARNEIGKPCDRIIYLSCPLVELTRGQAAMSKGCLTVFDKITEELVLRGVEVVVR